MGGFAITAAEMTVSGALASTGGRPYVAEGGGLLQVCAIPTRFCKLWIGFVPVSCVTTWPGREGAVWRGRHEIRRFVGAPFPASFRCPCSIASVRFETM